MTPETLTSPCDGTTCMRVTVVEGDQDYHEHGRQLHTHRGDKHWFDPEDWLLEDPEPDLKSWDGCTCGPQGPGHLYVSLDGTDVVHRPWCDLHPDDCHRSDCCGYDDALAWPHDQPTRHLRLVTP